MADLQTDIKQVKELRKRISDALKAIGNMDDFIGADSEIIFRFHSINGMLIMAHNDVNQMVKEWDSKL